MKKCVSILTLVVMSLALLTGCGDPVSSDLENFLNVEMQEVNENYEKIKTEAASWQGIEDEADLVTSLETVLLPLVNDSLEKLEKITPETEKVQDLKEKYVAVMEAYKEGFSQILAGVQTTDENEMLAGQEKLEKGLDLLAEYNTALETLAEEVGMELEY